PRIPLPVQNYVLMTPYPCQGSPTSRCRQQGSRLPGYIKRFSMPFFLPYNLPFTNVQYPKFYTGVQYTQRMWKKYGKTVSVRCSLLNPPCAGKSGRSYDLF